MILAAKHHDPWFQHLKHLLVSVAWSDLSHTSAYKSRLSLGKDGMENSPWLWAKGLGVNHNKLWFCRKLSSRESPGTPLDAFVYLLAYWTIP